MSVRQIGEITVSLPGPGTAALFGSALVFLGVAIGLLKEVSEPLRTVALIVVLLGGFLLLIVGVWIERESSKERRERCEKEKKKQ